MIEKKENHKELPALRRMTKMQVQEVYKPFEEGKTLDEVSKHFESRYNCKPLPKDRLRKHLTNFYKLKERNEDDKTHPPLPPVSIITNQDINVLKEKMLTQPPSNTLYSSSSEKTETSSNETEFGLPDLSGINLKFLFFVFACIILVFKILRLREKKKEKTKKSLKKADPLKEVIPQERLEKLNIKWV